MLLNCHRPREIISLTMLSLYSRSALGLGKNSLKPSVVQAYRSIKTIPQPPGGIVGTVNDAYVAPKPDKTHGSLHWTTERAVAIATIPFVTLPMLTGTTTVIDAVMSGLLLVHSYTGFQSCIIDYIPKRTYGSLHNYAMYLLTFGTGVAAYGVYEIEKKEGGIASIVGRLWNA